MDPIYDEALAGRLLCASAACYSIAGDGTLPDTEPRYTRGAGFTSPPRTFVSGPDAAKLKLASHQHADAIVDELEDLNACLVGSNSDGVILAFRGTLPLNLEDLTSLADWVNDARARLVDAPALGGKVHAGFNASLQSLWPELLPAVQEALAAHPSGRLYVTGHSKGGGSCPIAAARLLEAGIEPAAVYGFASPRAANADFAERYNARLGDRHLRFSYADDIVPHLPPSGRILDILSSLLDLDDLDDAAYVHVGALFYADGDDEVTGFPPFDQMGLFERLKFESFEARRNLKLGKLLLKGGFKQIGADHSAGCGSGYVRNFGPPSLCG